MGFKRRASSDEVGRENGVVDEMKISMPWGVGSAGIYLTGRGRSDCWTCEARKSRKRRATALLKRWLFEGFWVGVLGRCCEGCLTSLLALRSCRCCPLKPQACTRHGVYDERIIFLLLGLCVGR